MMNVTPLSMIAGTVVAFPMGGLMLFLSYKALESGLDKGDSRFYLAFSVLAVITVLLVAVVFGQISGIGALTIWLR